jgi:hypothetical protein
VVSSGVGDGEESELSGVDGLGGVLAPDPPEESCGPGGEESARTEEGNSSAPAAPGVAVAGPMVSVSAVTTADAPVRGRMCRRVVLVMIDPEGGASRTIYATPATLPPSGALRNVGSEPR